MQWRSLFRNLDLGATMANLGTPIAAGYTSSNLPIDLKAGAGLHLGENVLFAVDEEYQAIDAFNDVHAGLEVSTRVGSWLVAARGGYTYGPSDSADGGLTGVTAGLGAGFGPWQVDYAYSPQGDLGTAQRITLTWNGGD
jgi:hypothetical protein